MAPRTLFFRHGIETVRFAYKDGMEQIFWFSFRKYFELEEEKTFPWAVIDVRDLPAPYGEKIKAAWEAMPPGWCKAKWTEFRAFQKNTLIAFFEAGGSMIHECRRQWMTRHPELLPDNQKEAYAAEAARGGMFVADEPRKKAAPAPCGPDDDDIAF